MMEDSFHDYSLYYGDLHNHSGISYGHGTLADAFANARERLDFCSVTGHAHWTDMPGRNEENRRKIDYHVKGFMKLADCWPGVLEAAEEENEPGEFIVFPGFEVHSCRDGDYTVLYREPGPGREIIRPGTIGGLFEALRRLKDSGVESIAFPHHVGYKLGSRGLNWESFKNFPSPLVEIVSMHGGAESSESPRPFYHSMGPCDGKSTVQHGLAMGRVFGFLGNTDHHDSHPGSYGHGLSAVWSSGLSRGELWEALSARRTYALTGDKIRLLFSINGACMGEVAPVASCRNIKIELEGKYPVDYVDLVRNNTLVKRWSETDFGAGAGGPCGDRSETLLRLELGWGSRSAKPYAWEGTFGISEGEIVEADPLFRGSEVVSPSDKNEGRGRVLSRLKRIDGKKTGFRTVTSGNPTSNCGSTQGVCLRVRVPSRGGEAEAELNGKVIRVPLERLREGNFSGYINGRAFLFHRAPLRSEFCWRMETADPAGSAAAAAEADHDFYYVRVRQKNDQWAWSSPIFIKR